MNYLKNRDFGNLIKTAIPIILFFFIFQGVMAQEPPPRPIKVTKTQDLSFGVFYQGGGGGTVTVLWNGNRSASGTVVLLGMGGVPAIFSIIANRGTIITLLKPTSTLNDGSGHSLSLTIDTTNPNTPFVTTNIYPIPTLINIGGILTVGTPLMNPPGNYSGTFDITFVQQ